MLVRLICAIHARQVMFNSSEDLNSINFGTLSAPTHGHHRDMHSMMSMTVSSNFEYILLLP